MKKLEYSPDAAQKLRNIKHDVTINFGADVEQTCGVRYDADDATITEI